LNLDFRTFLVKIEVAKILYLQKIVDQTPNSFSNVLRIIKKSLNEAQNVLVRVSMSKTITTLILQPMEKLTCRPDKQLRKHKALTNITNSSMITITTTNFG